MTSPVIVQPSPETRAGSFPRRLWAMMLRHFYLYVGSWPRLVELFYWPMINITMYGFVSLYIMKKLNGVTVESNTFLGGVLLNEVFVRTTMALLVLFMEELWSRNLGHLFASPLKLADYIGSIMCASFIRCTLAVIPAFVVTYFLFGFSILQLGWPLAAYTALLFLNGWWYGLMIVALIMRFGLAAEWLGWMSTWLLIPFIAPYYPVSIMPPAFQVISWSLPATYVFESMKSQLANGNIRPDYLIIALGLNIAYFIAAWIIIRLAYRNAMIRGGLLQMGE